MSIFGRFALMLLVGTAVHVFFSLCPSLARFLTVVALTMVVDYKVHPPS
jgi:hypothetical protein